MMSVGSCHDMVFIENLKNLCGAFYCKYLRTLVSNKVYFTSCYELEMVDEHTAAG